MTDQRTPEGSAARDRIAGKRGFAAVLQPRVFGFTVDDGVGDLSRRSDRDQIARALTSRLVTYATGAAVRAADEAEIEAIVRNVRERNYGLRTLVHDVVGSKLFLHK